MRSLYSPPGRPSGWLVSPIYDLLLLANAFWPLILVPVFLAVPGFIRTGTNELQTEFWALYFIITPHRWITLILVATDADRRENHGRLFAGFAVVFAALVLGVWQFTGALTCLAVVDYIWNSWHFASQHQGVLRMYSRKSGGGLEWLERHGLRLFIAYTILRTAGWSTGWIEADTVARWWMNAVDLSLLAIPAAILTTNLNGLTKLRIPKLIYLMSVLGLYGGLLLSLRHDWVMAVFALTAATGLFHAVEYLAVVSHYAERRTTIGSNGLFREMAKRWLGLLTTYLVVLGVVGTYAADPNNGLAQLWLAINLWAAFLHYTYDGYIWKLRKPATAKALGVGA